MRVTQDLTPCVASSIPGLPSAEFGVYIPMISIGLGLGYLLLRGHFPIPVMAISTVMQNLASVSPFGTASCAILRFRAAAAFQDTGDPYLEPAATEFRRFLS